VRTYFAWGYGGQLLLIAPEMRLVAVMTSSITRTRGHTSRLFRFWEDVVAPAGRPEAMRTTDPTKK
jgi:CubicO group peptidase (beta-lactamase class C family)